MDLMGVSRTIDHAVYTLLNSLALLLWRLDAALLGIAMMGYDTQDWLTGRNGGVWKLLDWLVGPEGLVGLTTWQLFLLVALMLFGFSRVIRFIWPMQAVQLGRLAFFAVLAYVFISGGSALVQDIEAWREAAGGRVFEAMRAEDLPVDLPGDGGGDEPLDRPRDLDGRPPLRAWEAVATSYFLVETPAELHAATPPAAFRRAYCLYDPARPLNEQDEENEAGCSPQKAWDEWDTIEVTLPITNVWGIPLPDVGLSIDVPLVQEHPENRQLGIRQAQAGVSRLALGPVVALFPLLEANVGLLLALAASFVYLTLPVLLLFGFFLATESLATRLMLQYLTVVIRTVILYGLMAIFMVVLMRASVAGSLTTYLGVVGIGLVGGFFLNRVAAATMTETLSTALSAVGTLWMGAATGAFGETARRPARGILGAAKVAAAGAGMYAAARSGGLWRTADMAEPGLSGAQAGLRDMEQGDRLSRTAAYGVQRPLSRLPEPLVRLAAPAREMGVEQTGATNGRGSTPVAGYTAAPVAAAAATTTAATASQPTVTPPSPASSSSAPVSPPGPRSTGAVDRWVAEVYQTGPTAPGQERLAARGQALLGERLAKEAQGAMARHSQAETEAVLQAARQAAGNLPAEQVVQNGRLDPELLARIRAGLDEKTARSFEGAQGERDLAALALAGLRPQMEARPEAFRQAAARAPEGTGEQAPGRTVPRSLGLDPVAAGSYFAGLNRFTRLSEQAGLTTEQRQRLLAEVQTKGQVSDGLRAELAETLRQKGRRGISVKELEAGARALPETLRGPVQVDLPGPGRVETGRQGDRETGRQGDRETGRQGARETGRQGDKEQGRQGDKAGQRKSSVEGLTWEID